MPVMEPPTVQAKHILQSKTVIGSLGTLVVGLLAVYGHTIDPAVVTQLTDGITGAATDSSKLPTLIALLMTTGLTIYGRMKATQPIATPALPSIAKSPAPLPVKVETFSSEGLDTIANDTHTLQTAAAHAGIEPDKLLRLVEALRCADAAKAQAARSSRPDPSDPTQQTR